MTQLRIPIALAALFLSTHLVVAQAHPQTHTSATSPIETALSLRDSWSLQSSCKVEKSGQVISSPKFVPTGWYSVSVPTTVVSALVKQKVYPDPDFGMNLRKLPGMDYPIGANFSNIPMQQDSPFMVPWWYRKVFTLPQSYKGKTIWLDFAGINYRANIFLNGKQIAKKEDVALTNSILPMRLCPAGRTY